MDLFHGRVLVHVSVNTYLSGLRAFFAFWKPLMGELRCVTRCAGALMGAVGAGLALCFMHLHWGLRKLWLRLGLHVSPRSLIQICMLALRSWSIVPRTTRRLLMEMHLH